MYSQLPSRMLTDYCLMPLVQEAARLSVTTPAKSIAPPDILQPLQPLQTLQFQSSTIRGEPLLGCSVVTRVDLNTLLHRRNV
jgi:hypothetical protein